jgi:outer membrane biogenesis lipoprotein LolB
MIRRILLGAALSVLTACAGPERSAADASPAHSFNQDTVQTYNIQTHDFQQQAPFGAESNRSQ